MPDALDPPRTTLLMIDLQQEYLWPGGPMELPDAVPALERAAALLAAARAAGAPVVHVRHISDHPMAEEFRAGSPQVDPAAGGAGGRRDRHRQAGAQRLRGHPLEDLLRGSGAEAVIIAGFMTQTCCTATAHEALGRRYRTLFASDATAAQRYGPQSHAEVHERALDAQRRLGSEVLSSAEITALLQPA